MKMSGKVIAGVSAIAALVLPLVALAAGTTVVTPSNLQGWGTADTRPGGAVEFAVDANPPGGFGALRMTTTNDNAAKAQFMHAASGPLSVVTELGYYAKQNSAIFAGGNVSYQLPVFLNGTSGFTTFVYEPYQNGTVVNGTWQYWDVDAGNFWSTRSVTCSGGSVVAGGGGAPFYTLAQIKTMCPDAEVLGFGVNIGSFNPGYDVLTDLVNFNGDIYDFEPALTPQSKESCKDGGWVVFNSPVFKNQGECVSFFNHNN